MVVLTTGNGVNGFTLDPVSSIELQPAKTSVSPRSSPLGTFHAEEQETSPAANSKEKRMFSQADRINNNIATNLLLIIIIIGWLKKNSQL